MKNSETINNFDFKFKGYGQYLVSYTSAKTGKKWYNIISDMQLIDATKNNDNPKKKDLNELRRIVKNS